MENFKRKDMVSRLAIVTVLMTATLPPVSCANQPQGESTPATMGETVNPQRLVGQWIRQDGGYILEISRVRSNGKLEASYRNPRPINVETAELRREDDQLGVFIELRDRGYPGSYYELVYSVNEDALVGRYFQALQQMVYEVIFVRRPQ